MNLDRRSAAGLLLLLLASCSSNSSAPTTTANPVGPEDIIDVILVPGASDDALLRMLNSSLKTDARQVVSVDTPDPNASVPKDSPATFQWRLASQATRAPGPHLGPAAPPPSKWRRPWHEFLQLLAPERIAHAHGTPYNGTAYFLVFSGADSKRILRVFTPNTSFTPEALDWQHLADAPQPLKLEITSAFFDENAIPADGGPFVGGTFSFLIE